MNKEKASNQNFWLNFYIILVGVAGVIALLIILTLPLPTIHPIEIVFLTLLNLAFSFFQVTLPSGMSISLSFPITMGIFLLFGPVPAIITLIPGLLIHSLRRGTPWRIPFNIGQASLSLILASSVFRLYGAFPSQLNLQDHFLLMVGVLFLFDIFSNALVCGALALQGRGNYFKLFFSSLISDVIKIIPVYYTIGIIFTLVYQQEGIPGGILVSLPLVSVFFILRDQQIIKESQEEAYSDPLTGLFNRRYTENWFSENLDEFIEEDRDLSLLLLDIDNFKFVNDNYGHQMGDGVLELIAREMEISVRDSDIISRHGGEEFMVILPDTPPEIAYQVGERIRENIACKDFEINNTTINLTVSLGMSSLRNQEQDQKNKEELIRQADNAAYLAKFQGKNQVCSYHKTS